MCELVLTSGDFFRKNWTSFRAAHSRSGLSAVCKKMMLVNITLRKSTDVTGLELYDYKLTNAC